MYREFYEYLAQLFNEKNAYNDDDDDDDSHNRINSPESECLDDEEECGEYIEMDKL